MISQLTHILFRLLLLVLSVITLYFLIPFNVAKIQFELLNNGSDDTGSINRTLHWNPKSREALLALAEQAKDQEDFDKARDYAIQTLEVDPTNGQAMSILITVYSHNQDSVNSIIAIDLAPRLWAAHSYVHSTIADYWAKKGDIEKVFSEWDLLLTRHRVLYKPLFPILSSYANTSTTRSLLSPYATKPAFWWNDFFAYMAYNNVSLPILNHFYQLKVMSNIPLGDNERKAYIYRLQQNRLWELAYSVWITGLKGRDFSYIGLLFDGGFESSRYNTAYDWNFNRKSKIFKITLGRTRGIQGKRALHISFKRRKSISFKHIWQRLQLEPNRTYRVSMQTRIDSLKNPVGLTWRVRCDNKKHQLLGESLPLKGKSKWHEVSFNFAVPRHGCGSQLIRLEVASKYRHQQIFEGGIWFDQIDLVPE